MKLSTEVRYEAVVYLLGNCVCGIGSIACGCSEVIFKKRIQFLPLRLWLSWLCLCSSGFLA